MVKLDGTLKISKKININYTNNKFYYSVNGVDENNNPFDLNNYKEHIKSCIKCKERFKNIHVYTKCRDHDHKTGKYRQAM